MRTLMLVDYERIMLQPLHILYPILPPNRLPKLRYFRVNPEPHWYLWSLLISANYTSVCSSLWFLAPFFIQNNLS